MMKNLTAKKILVFWPQSKTGLPDGTTGELTVVPFLYIKSEPAS